MAHKLLFAGLLVLLQATPALAQSQPTDISGAAQSRDLEHPGNLTAKDVTGKRLLDADGALMGMIVGVSADGRSAILRPAGCGKRTSVAMSGLSIGMGSHTVTDDINSSARNLNTRSAPSDTTVTTRSPDAPPRPAVSSETVTTTTTVQHATIPGN